MNTTKKYLKKFIKIIKKPEMKVLPGHLSFFLVLSLIPIITIVGYVASLFNVSVDTVVNMMNVSLPNEVNNLLIPFITGSGMDFMPLALREGCDVLITGDITFHKADEAEAAGLSLIDATHFGTDLLSVKWIAQELRIMAAELCADLTVYEAQETDLYVTI